VDSRFDDWIYLTSILQLHSVITVQTCNSFWITNPSLHSSASFSKHVDSLPSHFFFFSFFRVLSYPVFCLSLSLILRPTVSRPVCLGTKHPTGAYDQILLLSDSCRFVDLGRSVWREDGSVTYNCRWSSPAQSFSGPNTVGLATVFYCLRFETFSFRRLLRLAGLRWRYSIPPPHGICLLSSVFLEQ
jgi:hypothetical protein